MSGNANSASVRLPKRDRSQDPGAKPPVWSIDQSASMVPVPLGANCSRHQETRHGVCCKELKPDDERQLVDPDVVRDM